MASEGASNMSVRRAAILAWLSAFAFTELLGTATLFVLYPQHNIIYSRAFAYTLVVLVRFYILVKIARMCGVRLSYAIYRPQMSASGLTALILASVIIIFIDYAVTVVAYNDYKPQLFGVLYYIEEGALWAFPFELAYYFSEIVNMNYIYVLARRAWGFRAYTITSGTILLLFLWALPHVITKSVAVAVVAVLFTLVSYSAYEHGKTPLIPIILWFIMLAV